MKQAGCWDGVGTRCHVNITMYIWGPSQNRTQARSIMNFLIAALYTRKVKLKRRMCLSLGAEIDCV